MVKLTTSVLAATLLSVPVLAVASEYERSLSETDLYGRDFAPEDDVVLLTREDVEDLFGRDFVEELEAREPLGFGIISKGFSAFRHGIGHLGHFGHGGSGHHHHHHMPSMGGGDNSQQQQQQRREFVDDLEEREPLGFGIISKGFSALRHGVSHFGHHAHHHHMPSIGGGDNSQQQQQQRREFVDDLEERDPLGFGIISKGFSVLRHGVGHFGHHAHHHHMPSMGGGDNSQQQQPSRRDLAEEFEPEDLFSREFVDDLEEREPLGFGIISKGFSALRHGVSHFGHHAHHHHMPSIGGGDNSQQQQQQRRDLGDYGYYDELD